MSEDSDPPVVGIDLGTCYCSITIGKDGRAEVVSDGGSKTIPSVVTFYENRVEYGLTAKNNRLNPGAMPVYELKRLLGLPYKVYRSKCGIDLTTYSVLNENNKIVLQLNRDYEKNTRIYPEHVYSMFFSYFASRASEAYGSMIRDAVITVPASFTPIQIHETIVAAELAGLNVMEVEYEPSAAALECKPLLPRGAQYALICDMGAGTVDISLLSIKENKLVVLNTSGDPCLGGCDFDMVLADLFCQKLMVLNPLFYISRASNRYIRLVQQMESFKIQLSSKRSPDETIELHVDSLLGIASTEVVTISVQEFIEACYELYSRILRVARKCIEEAKIVFHQYDCVLLVGGSSRLPGVREGFMQAFDLDKEHVILPDDPDTIVSRGAYRIAVNAYYKKRAMPTTPLPMAQKKGLAFDIYYRKGQSTKLALEKGNDLQVIHTHTLSFLEDGNRLYMYIDDKRFGYFDVPVTDFSHSNEASHTSDAESVNRKKSKYSIELIVDERLELQLQFSVGEINGRVSFIYDNDVSQEERKRIATINDLYSLLNRLRRERRNDGQAQQRVAEWESTEVGNRLKWCNNDIERMVGLIHETFAMYSVCLALCVFWRFVFAVQNSTVFRQGRLELKECLLVVSLDPFAVAPA